MSLKESLKKKDQTYNEKDEELLSNLTSSQTYEEETEDTKSKLERLGFKTATKKVGSAEKLAFAYKMYLYVSQEDINNFNDKLREETLREDEHSRYFKELVFYDIGDYPEVPPGHVLTALEKAQKDNCFDAFEIAKIEWRNQPKIPDPIVFGRVEGSTDRFFIAQWDDDVSIEDILKANEK